MPNDNITPFGASVPQDRKIDIIFCIDGTGSMSPCIDKVKQNVMKFYSDFVHEMTTEHNTNIEELNIKIITFRDYSEPEPAMEQSEWFDMNAGDDTKCQKHVDGIVADGGGDDPENGLEALFYAMTTKWNARGTKDRQIIVLFTDADAIKFGTQAGQPGYPSDMVDEAGLINTWFCTRPAFLGQGEFNLNDRCKRLVMFAPANTYYQELQSKLNRSQFIPVQMDAGLGDIDFKDIIKIIAASASSV